MEPFTCLWRSKCCFLQKKKRDALKFFGMKMWKRAKSKYNEYKYYFWQLQPNSVGGGIMFWPQLHPLWLLLLSALHHPALWVHTFEFTPLTFISFSLLFSFTVLLFLCSITISLCFFSSLFYPAIFFLSCLFSLLQPCVVCLSLWHLFFCDVLLLANPPIFCPY